VCEREREREREGRREKEGGRNLVLAKQAHAPRRHDTIRSQVARHVIQQHTPRALDLIIPEEQHRRSRTQARQALRAREQQPSASPEPRKCQE